MENSYRDEDLPWKKDSAQVLNLPVALGTGPQFYWEQWKRLVRELWKGDHAIYTDEEQEQIPYYWIRDSVRVLRVLSG